MDAQGLVDFEHTCELGPTYIGSRCDKSRHHLLVGRRFTVESADPFTRARGISGGETTGYI